jgi:hypothetical protein
VFADYSCKNTDKQPYFLLNLAKSDSDITFETHESYTDISAKMKRQRCGMYLLLFGILNCNPKGDIQ